MSRISRLAIVIGPFVVLAIIALGFVVTSPTNAATIDKLSVTCTITTVKGKTEVAAPFVRLHVVLASDLSVVLATRVVPVINRVDASYLLSARYAPQATNTLLVISVGEWDGSRYLQPATLTSRFCNGGGGS